MNGMLCLAFKILILTHRCAAAIPTNKKAMPSKKSDIYSVLVSSRGNGVIPTDADCVLLPTYSNDIFYSILFSLSI